MTKRIIVTDKPKKKIDPRTIAKALGADIVCKVNTQGGWMGAMSAYEEIKNMRAIIGTNKQHVEIESLGYQFPDADELAKRAKEQNPHMDDKTIAQMGIYDLNWLNIRIKVVTPDLKWEKTDPALDTSDLEKLADWFKTRRSKKIWFTEPCLEIERLTKKGNLYQFDFTFAYNFSSPKGPITVRIEATKDQVDRFVVGLRNELKKFPFRHVAEKRNIAKEIIQGFKDIKSAREGKIRLKTTVVKR